MEFALCRRQQQIEKIHKSFQSPCSCAKTQRESTEVRLIQLKLPTVNV